MRAAAACGLLALALAAFAWWGMNTAAGRQAYDEMAGIVPFAAPVPAVVGAALAWRAARRVRRRDRP